jgi:two-component system, chemotaxis family, CheB/CheR fusion protein
MNGFGLARRIRQHGLPTYLVAVTGWSQPQDRANSIAAGFDEHLAKPASVADILRIVQRVKRESNRPTPSLETE